MDGSKIHRTAHISMQIRSSGTKEIAKYSG